MTAVVYQIRDYQSAKDIDRMQRELEKEAAVYPRVIYGIDLESVEMIPYGGQGIDGMTFTDNDPA